MTLEDNIQNIINEKPSLFRRTINFLKRKSLPYILSIPIIIFPIACGKHKKSIPIMAENPTITTPTITTSSLPNAKENFPYSFAFFAVDPQSDPITYSITGGTADVFLIIDPITGELSNDTLITDIESDRTHDLKVKVTDSKGNFSERTFSLYVINTENITGNVKVVTNDNNLSGMRVWLSSSPAGSFSTLTDSNGNYVFNDVEDREYTMEIDENTVSENNYFTHKAGTLITNKQKNLEGKLSNINFKLIPTSFRPGDTKDTVLRFIYECIRTSTDGSEKDIKKWDIRPTFRIYTLEWSTGNPVDPAKIAIVRDVIQNELYQVDPLFTNPDIEEIAIIVPAGFFDNIVKVYWNDNVSGAKGWNDNQFNGDTLTAAYAGCKTNQVKDVWMQELTECVIGSGESNIYPSILNDPLTTSDYTWADFNLWKIYQNRLKGNKDLGTAHNHDVNPSSYIINP